MAEELHVRTEETKDVGACGEKAWTRLDSGVDMRENGGAEQDWRAPPRRRGLEVGAELVLRDEKGRGACSACAATDERVGR